jgi:hypothetical protein
MAAEGPSTSEPCICQEPPDESATYVDALATELARRGLKVGLGGPNVLLAANPAASTDDPRGQAMSPGLSQRVACLRRGDGRSRWWWFWAWPGPTVGSLPDLEPFCPAEDIMTAAQAIARVLATPGNNT